MSLIPWYDSMKMDKRVFKVARKLSYYHKRMDPNFNGLAIENLKDDEAVLEATERRLINYNGQGYYLQPIGWLYIDEELEKSGRHERFVYVLISASAGLIGAIIGALAVLAAAPK